MRQRQPFYARVMRMRNEVKPSGRPARDPRHAAILEFLAERRDGFVTNAEARAHLQRRGLSPKPAYVGNLLATLAQEGVLSRAAHGRYEINGSHPRLQHIRWRTAHQAQAEALKAETARLMALNAEREKRPYGGRQPTNAGEGQGSVRLQPPYACWNALSASRLSPAALIPVDEHAR